MITKTLMSSENVKLNNSELNKLQANPLNFTKTMPVYFTKTMFRIIIKLMPFLLGHAIHIAQQPLPTLASSALSISLNGFRTF